MPLQSGRAAITGIAKGSGMIHPQMATMLVYLLTDVQASAGELRSLLRPAVSDSFNAISIDGDTSTNDTVLLLASAASGIPLRKIRTEFENALLSVCRSLAEQIVADGEGVQHVIRLKLNRRGTGKEALQVARTIAHSLLVKTAWAGADPTGVAFWQRSAERNYVPAWQIISRLAVNWFAASAIACDFDAQRAHQELSQPECSVTVRLGRGKSSLEFLTGDLTQEYVKINADYST